MEFLKFDINKCVLCGVCVEKCPFGALTIEGNGIVVGDACRMCGLCVRNCPEKAIRFEQKAKDGTSALEKMGSAAKLSYLCGAGERRDPSGYL